MKTKSAKTILIIVFSIINNWIFSQTANQPEINVVYGDKHIFTIETPTNWINDKESAQKVGLVCFFYPITEINKTHLNYCYVNGIDKTISDENLDDFIKGDLEKFRKKYPDLTFEKVPVEITGGIRNGVLYSFSNLTDRFKEEVLYSETDDSFIIFSFSVETDEDYEKYQPIFDEFVSSCNYRGNNPQPFLDHLKKQRQN